VHDPVDVELSWTATAALRFRLYRDAVKTALGRSPVAPDVPGTGFRDGRALERAGLDFYRVKGLSPCTSTPGPRYFEHHRNIRARPCRRALLD
jgi:hypothetical protein